MKKVWYPPRCPTCNARMELVTQPTKAVKWQCMACIRRQRSEDLKIDAEGATLEEVGAQFGMARQTLQKIERKALRKLRWAPKIVPKETTNG